MNRGAEQLRGKLIKRGARAALAKGVGVKPYQVSHWLAGGDRKPNYKQRAFLEDEYGVGWRLWDEEVKTKRRSAA